MSKPFLGLAALMESHLKSYLEAHEEDLPASGLYDVVLREVEKPLLKLVFKKVKGNQAQGARVLGINRNTFRKKLAEYGLLKASDKGTS